MLNPINVPKLKEHLSLVVQQLSLLENKIKNSKDLEARDNTQEEERNRILDLLGDHKANVPVILQEIEKRLPQQKEGKLSLPDKIASLIKVDKLLVKMKQDIEHLAKEHDECNLDLHKQEVVKAVELCMEAFDLLVPNIRHEITYLEKYYRLPENMGHTIIPELNKLTTDLEKHEISLEQFLNGHKNGQNGFIGYKDLRSQNHVYPKYQYYDYSPETYREINTCFYEMCTTIEPLLKEKKGEGDFDNFLTRVRDRSHSIARMSDIFEAGALIESVHKATAIKYSFADEVKKMKPLLEQFKALKNKLIVYNDEALAHDSQTLNQLFTEEKEKNRLKNLMEEVQQGIEEKTLSFKRIGKVYNKLEKKNFNVVVQDREANDITIKITPVHEGKYGRDLLERINTIILEIDFWYPPDTKQVLFQDLSQTTKKIQEDEPIDKNDFLKLMQRYDKEMEEGIRKTYPERIKELNSIYAGFQKVFAEKVARDRLATRLANQKIWEEINPKLQAANRSLRVLGSGDASLNAQVNKFPFLKMASENMCQLLYDLSMQMFVLFNGVEEPYVTHMTNILSTFNEFHDAPALWAAFAHYQKKVALPNLPVNEKLIISSTKNPNSKARLKELFPEEEE